MDSHKGSYDSSSEAPVVKEDLQGLIDDVATSHTRNHDEGTAIEQHNPGNHPLGAAATAATHAHTKHETALSREIEDILQGLVDEAIASAYEDEEEEPVPGGGGAGQQSALAALLARVTSQQRGGGNRAAPPPTVIVISSDEENSSSGDEPFPRFLMRCSRGGGKRSRGSVKLPGTPTTATYTTGGSSGFPSPASSSARSSRASTIRCDDPDANAGCQESIVAKIQRRPAVEFPRHAYGRRQKRRYETSSDDDEGADRGNRRRRRRSRRAGEQAEAFIDLTLDSEPEEPPRVEAPSSPAAPNRPPKKKKPEQKQKREGNDKQKRRPEPPAGKRSSIGRMAAAAAAARSGKRWRY
ncbi:hypothetical protein DL768_004665 [Monosporascus sp. mg162]|nr:hypothetical protein DL768_004665 [Monosporascus sp. mg162]